MESPPADAPKRVFISYARVDRVRLEPLGEALTARGYSVWWDVNIPGGAAFAREIETALRQADAVVVAWSCNSIDSDWVRDEAALGRDLGRLAPITLDDALPPLGFGQYQVIDFSKWEGDPAAREVARLVHAIERTSDTHPTTQTGATQGSGRARRPAISRRTVLISAAAAPLIAGGAWLALKSAPAAAKAPSHSIAVLPFVNLSGDPGQDYFSDGLSEDLRGALTRIEDLQVAARASSNAFRNAHQSISVIAKSLGVAYVLEGSVRRAGDVVRVNAQLTDAQSGFQKWSQTYDRTMKDVFAIQSEIAGLVADALKVKMLGSAKTSTGGTSNAVAFDHYLSGRHLYDQSGNEATYRQALAEFDAAIAADPGYADAHAARARILIAIGNQFGSGSALKTLYREGIQAAEKAVQLAPDLAASQSTLGFARFTALLDVRGAADPYERARALGQGDAGVLSGYAAYAASVGKFDAALKALQRAVVLDPLNPPVYRNFGVVYYAARRYPEAIQQVERALAINPKMLFAHSVIGDCLLLQGDIAGARAQFLKEPLDVNRLTGSAILDHAAGADAEANKALAALTALGDNTLYQQAEVRARMGQTAKALDVLDRAYAVGDSGLTYLRNDPMLDSLRREPRFIQLAARIGFV